MKTSILNFLSIVLFSIICLYLNFKKSGGDIFVYIIVVSFSLALLIINIILALILRFKLKNSLFGVLLGAIFSILLIYIVVSLT